MTDYLDLISERLSFSWYRSRHLRDGSFLRRPKDAQQVLMATKMYVRSTLMTHLSIERGSPITIELPAKGLTNLLWKVRLGERRCMVYCYTAEQHPRMDQQLTALRLMQENHVRAPRILHSVADPSKHSGVYFITTEFIEGISRAGKEQHFTDDELDSLARQLALLHSVPHSKWGRLCLPRNSDYFARQLRLVSRYLKMAEKRAVLSGGQLPKLRAWFENWRGAFNKVSRYSLIHGDLHPNNLLFEKDGTCCLLDTDRVAWNLGMWDIELVHERICRRNPERIRHFDTRYTELLPPEDRELHNTLSPFFAALFRLRLSVRDAADPEYTDSMKESWKELLRITGTT